MRTMLSVLFTVALAAGWQWINVLSRQGQMADALVLWLGGGLTLVLALQQLYTQIAHPSSPEQARKAEVIANDYLRGLLAKYYEYMKKLNARQQPNVRINVMLPTSWYKLRKFLRMYYTATLPGVSYRNEEQVLAWKKGQGVCGWAWKHRMRGLYDAVRPGFDTAAKKRTIEQEKIAGALKSIYAEPIFFDGKVVGILNLDSDSDLTETRFDDPVVQDLVKTYADNLAAVCFPDGVRHQ